MGKQIRKGQNITPRHTFPITESMSDDSRVQIDAMRMVLADQEMQKIRAIQRVHSRH